MSDVCPKCGAGCTSHDVSVFVCGSSWMGIMGQTHNEWQLEEGTDCLRRQLASEKALRENAEETNRNNVACAEMQVGDLTKWLEKAEAACAAIIQGANHNWCDPKNECWEECCEHARAMRKQGFDAAKDLGQPFLEELSRLRLVEGTMQKVGDAMMPYLSEHLGICVTRAIPMVLDELARLTKLIERVPAGVMAWARNRIKEDEVANVEKSKP